MPERDDLPIFRPSFGSGRRPASGNGAASFRNAVLSSARRIGGAAKAARPRSRIAATRPDASARRVVVKAHFVRLAAGGAKAAALHLRYIERDGVERDGSKGLLYGPNGPERAETFEQPLPGEQHQFRLIVSPEDADQLDLTAYVRRYMARVEQDLGRRLQWAAVNHFDTDHPHAHIVVRGVDRQGQELRFERAYISNGLRWRAQELATEELGPRPVRDIQRAYVKEITQDRLTSLDRHLERSQQEAGRIDIAALQPHGGTDRTLLVARLEHLERLGLAERRAANSWTLSDGWQRQLKDLGERGDILKQIHAAMSGDPSRYQILRDGRPLPTDDPTRPRPITGRVAAKGLSDELKGSFYAIVETPDGRGIHVPLDRRSAEALRPGDVVSLSTKPESPVRPVDRHLHQQATANHGVYAPPPDAAQIVTPEQRRLRELERLGLATPLDASRWKVAPDLLQRLEQQPQPAEPRHRLLLNKEPLDLARQVRHPGPVWLDRLRTRNLAPYGLGAELQRLVTERREALRQIGIQRDDPQRMAKLRDLEVHSAAKLVTDRTGQTFLPTPPPNFRGRVELADPTSPGQAYAIVSDGSRFALIRATPAVRSTAGQQVMMTQDAKGHPTVRKLSDLGRDF